MHGLISHVGEQLGDRFLENGVAGLRVQLRQGLEREATAVELGMRDVEAGLVHHPVSPEEDVEV